MQCYTGLPTKYYTSETIVRNFTVYLHLGFLVGQNGLISVPNRLKHLIETKIKLQIVIFLEFWVVFTVSSFVVSPVNDLPSINEYENILNIMLERENGR